jgi:hypothetical protein
MKTQHARMKTSNVIPLRIKMIIPAFLAGLFWLPSTAQNQQNASVSISQKASSKSVEGSVTFSREELLAKPEAEFKRLMNSGVKITDLIMVKEVTVKKEGVKYLTEAEFYLMPNDSKRQILSNPGLFVVTAVSSDNAKTKIKKTGTTPIPVKEGNVKSTDTRN